MIYIHYSNLKANENNIKTSKDLQAFIETNGFITADDRNHYKYNIKRLDTDEAIQIKEYNKFVCYYRILQSRRIEKIETSNCNFIDGKHIFYTNRKSDEIQVKPENLVCIYVEK